MYATPPPPVPSTEHAKIRTHTRALTTVSKIRTRSPSSPFLDCCWLASGRIQIITRTKQKYEKKQEHAHALVRGEGLAQKKGNDASDPELQNAQCGINPNHRATEVRDRHGPPLSNRAYNCGSQRGHQPPPQWVPYVHDMNTDALSCLHIHTPFPFPFQPNSLLQYLQVAAAAAAAAVVVAAAAVVSACQGAMDRRASKQGQPDRGCKRWGAALHWSA